MNQEPTPVFETFPDALNYCRKVGKPLVVEREGAGQFKIWPSGKIRKVSYSMAICQAGEGFYFDPPGGLSSRIREAIIREVGKLDHAFRSLEERFHARIRFSMTVDITP